MLYNIQIYMFKDEFMDRKYKRGLSINACKEMNNLKGDITML